MTPPLSRGRRRRHVLLLLNFEFERWPRNGYTQHDFAYFSFLRFISSRREKEGRSNLRSTPISKRIIRIRESVNQHVSDCSASGPVRQLQNSGYDLNRCTRCVTMSRLLQVCICHLRHVRHCQGYRSKPRVVHVNASRLAVIRTRYVLPHNVKTQSCSPSLA